MNYRTYSDMASLIRANQSLIKSYDFDLVVGIPRSGMLPASIIALNLNLPLMTLNEYENNSNVKHGITRDISKSLKNASDAKKVLIVDDSILTGKSIKNVKDTLILDSDVSVIYMAVYGEFRTDLIDICLEYVNSPRVFEWNIFHHSNIKRSCFDIDGVLCRDPTPKENDDGPNYLDFIQNIKPLFTPSGKISKVVTNRLSKYQVETENWLNKNGIKYEELIMLDMESKNDRLNQDDYYSHKSNVYKQSDDIMFFESDFKQAIEISKRSGKHVYCVDENVMVSPGFIYSISTTSAMKNTLKSFIKRIPFGRGIINFIKKL